MSSTYLQRRGQIEAYFDRTAAEAWRRLTSDAPVSRIRQSVRAGRDRMRATLVDWLPPLDGRTLLDAGCGTGALAVKAAELGAKVTAIDLSPTLIGIARERLAIDPGSGSVEFTAGDMLDAKLGDFDHMVAMDSLIHYEPADMVAALRRLIPRCRGSILFTFAPKTLALSAMHATGKLFPRSDRSPSIVPVTESVLRSMLDAPEFAAWRVGRTLRISSAFYVSQAMELVRVDHAD